MKLIPKAVSMKAARHLLVGKKNSPAILFGVGVAGVIGSTVLACRATLKLEEVLDKAQSDLEIANKLAVAVVEGEDVEYSNSDKNRDTAVIYARGIISVGKLYAPAVILGVGSISALTASHNILTKRNIALTAAYTAVDRAFNEYRERVVEKYGEDQDRIFRYDTEKVEIVNENGKKVVVDRAGPGAASMYARFFDPLSTEWNKESEYNMVFLRCQQNYANDLLKARGHVFLNDVYDMLGLPRSSAGSVVGWVISYDHDNYIDFGIFQGDNAAARDFVNGRENSILLDFNVDGVIYDKIDEAKRGEVAWQS